jgi:tRNA(Ile)-lysidine synthase
MTRYRKLLFDPLDRLSPDRLFGDLRPEGIVIVAVSGGSDSVALLLLANVWAQSRDIPLHAVTVDHGLRPEAAAEAAFVAGICEGLDIDHTTLGWEGIKPHSGVADAARRARYTLIEEFAQEVGADMILAGHTADDQAETLYMRGARQADPGKDSESGTGRGMAGIPRLSRLPAGCMLARPLVDVSRDMLRNYLKVIPQPWIEDPSNDDDAYERVRVRRMLNSRPYLRDRLNRFGQVMSDFRALLARDTANLLTATVSIQPGPVFQFNYAVALAAPAPVFVHAMQMLVAVSGGSEHVAPRSKVDRLVAALGEPDFSRVTLGGSVVERAGGALRFYRENRNLPTLSLHPGESAVWDGRMVFTNGAQEVLLIGPVGRRRLLEIEAERNRTFHVRPRAALLSGPLAQTPSGCVWLPMVENGPGVSQARSRLTARAIEHFCPQSDFALLDWLQGIEDARNACLEPRN